MNNTIALATGLSLTALVGGLAGTGGVDVINRITAEPSSYGAKLVSLKYRDGKFIQHVQPVGIKALPMKQVAKITRNKEIICSGGFTSVYDGEIDIMSPDLWTNDNCPELKNGDIAIATWTYQTVDRQNVTITSKITLRDLETWN